MFVMAPCETVSPSTSASFWVNAVVGHRLVGMQAGDGGDNAGPNRLRVACRQLRATCRRTTYVVTGLETGNSMRSYAGLVGQTALATRFLRAGGRVEQLGRRPSNASRANRSSQVASPGLISIAAVEHLPSHPAAGEGEAVTRLAFSTAFFLPAQP